MMNWQVSPRESTTTEESPSTPEYLSARIESAGVFVHDRLGATPLKPARDAGGDSVATFFPEWSQYATSGIRMGVGSAPLTIIVLSDFECPFCRQLAKNLDYIQENHPRTVSVVFHHYPLANHRFAEPAARAAECAHAQGNFKAFHDLVFAKQDSLGLKAWSSFAEDAEVSDLGRFERCRSGKEQPPRIETGLEIGRTVGLRGTPTVLLNGWKLARPPSLRELEKSVRAVEEGRPPTG